MNPRTINPVAIAQLKQWEEMALKWPVRYEYKLNDMHLCCATCGITVFAVEHYHKPYTASLEIYLAAMVAHLRNVHRDIEKAVYQDDKSNGSEDTEPVGDAGIASSVGSSDTDTH
jgi:hypothetical protein